jgi:hypothetical protein
MPNCHQPWSRAPAGANPRVDGYLERLAAIFPKVAHYLADDMLRAGAYAMSEFVRRYLDERLVDICNYPSSYSRFLPA